jgi:hypothetical protein
MENYKFIKDYTYKTGSSCPEGMLGCMPDTIIFKKDDILGGLTNNLSKDGKTVTSFRGNFSYIIPIEYLISTEENQPVINAPAPPTKSSGDAFFPKLAGAYNQNLIIAVVLVAGYFAYKKFKK